jgi:hypothetical protein
MRCDAFFERFKYVHVIYFSVKMIVFSIVSECWEWNLNHIDN